MMFAVPAEPYEFSPDGRARAQPAARSCTPTTSRTARRRPCAWSARSQANLFASIAAGICALWGPLHGGANQAVIEMLEMIRRRRRRLPEVRRPGQGQGLQLPADGLRPPRLQELRPARARSSRRRPTRCSTSSASTTRCSTSPRASRRSRSRDAYFIERKLYPNVDFYSGILYRAMGIPTNMFTVMFALGRLPGWIAHWKEMKDDPDNRINRPAPDLHRRDASAPSCRWSNGSSANGVYHSLRH